MIKRQVIATVLPALNQENGIYDALQRVKKGEIECPDFSFVHFTVDDGSSDRTHEKILLWGRRLGLEMQPHQNKHNKGLVTTLKEAYGRALDINPDYVLKTDLDKDFDQTDVIQTLTSFIGKDVDVAVGIKWRDFDREENEYEFDRREHLSRILERELSFDLDTYCGSQLFRASALRQLIEHPQIKNYDKKWGLDFRMAVLAAHVGLKVETVGVERGKYDASRRPREKVQGQYDSYLQTISEITGKPLEELTRAYGEVPQ